ncbi:uncharacterized protein LOC120526939 isoform X2 [Polypterus senegalus]|uniref:uncharacterized protein LOC120526939 isoform X2 n=1 Tax=Polypterus senegalus TaxID=55291 RepID=UPI0019664A22|nr:uncharacterized protein LOC120526939 isoform X2 [Polypterus senegalus]
MFDNMHSGTAGPAPNCQLFLAWGANWFNLACSWRSPFLCYKDLSQTSPSSSTISTHGTLSTPKSEAPQQSSPGPSPPTLPASSIPTASKSSSSSAPYQTSSDVTHTANPGQSSKQPSTLTSDSPSITTYNTSGAPYLTSSQRTNASSPGVVLIQQAMTWYEAQSYCRLNHNDLLQVTDEMTQNTLSSVTHDGQGDGLWIGLKKHLLWEFWYWSGSGQLVGYTNWGQGKTNETPGVLCGMVTLNDKLTWAGGCCGTQLSFLCQ